MAEDVRSSRHGKFATHRYMRWVLVTKGGKFLAKWHRSSVDNGGWPPYYVTNLLDELPGLVSGHAKINVEDAQKEWNDFIRRTYPPKVVQDIIVKPKKLFIVLEEVSR